MRYIVEKRAAFYGHWNPDANSTADQVHEREPEDTGLLDASGRRIVREMDPIGFVRMKEAA